IGEVVIYATVITVLRIVAGEVLGEVRGAYGNVRRICRARKEDTQNHCRYGVHGYLIIREWVAGRWIDYRRLDAGEIASAPRRWRHQLVQQKFLRPPRSFISEKEEGLVLGVVDSRYAERTAKARAEIVGLQFWLGRREGVPGIQRIALKEPETGAVIKVAAAFAYYRQVAWLRKLCVIAGCIDSEFGDGFH